MAHLRRIVSDPSCAALALVLSGVCVLAGPRAAVAAPDDDDVLSIDDDDDAPVDDSEDAPLAEDEDEEEEAAPSASGRASVSLGGGADASGKASGKKAKKAKKAKEPKEPKVKDERPFIRRYGPVNHMLNAGGYLGAFIRADNHGLFDRAIGPQPFTKRTSLDLGFRLEYMPIPYVGVGFEASGMPTTGRVPPSNADRKAGFYTVRAHVVGSLPYRLTPTLAVGGGLLGLRSRGTPILNGGDGAFHWGPGLKFFVNEWIAVRVDGRHIVTGSSIDGNRAHHGEVLFGAEVTLRLTKFMSAKYRGERSDRDNDTVADYYDECPDEYGEDENGCPLDRDSDKDGIKDSRDKCPKEWGDGPDGCPIPDKDGDGILDDNDRCVDEAENYNGIEDTDGCPDELPDEVKQFEGVIEGIYFDTGKSTIRKTSRPKLGKVAELLKKYPQLRIEISGHTDSVGSEADNVKLSQARADAVKQFLVDDGIEEGRIATRGAGPNEPIAENKSKKGRSKNRRIEFKVR